MAKRTTTLVLDDLTGAELGDDNEPISFALDGITYEIDLAPTTAKELREALAPFIGAARKVGRTGRGGRTSSSRSIPVGEQSAARAWLLEQGVDVPARGRLSAELLGRYRSR